MRVFTKAILDREQVLARRKITTEGIEILLFQKDFTDPDLIDKLALCCDNFETVNLEAPIFIDEKYSLDLLNPKARRYLEKALGLLSRFSNMKLLTTHFVGDSQLCLPPYDCEQNDKHDTLEKCLEYVNSIDPKNKLIALENTFPVDYTNGKTPNLLAIYPIGKISSDFSGRIRTFDIGHSSMTALVLSKLFQKNGIFYYHSEQFGDVPVYFTEEEKKVAETAKKSLTEAVVEELTRANVVNVHVNVNQGIKDGYLPEDSQDLDLPKILEVVKDKDITFVTEVKERETGDYVNVSNQKKMFDYLKQK